jgi:hypothetical protein
MRLQYGVRGEDSTVPWVSADGCPLGQGCSYLSRNCAGEQKTLTPALSHSMGEGRGEGERQFQLNGYGLSVLEAPSFSAIRTKSARDSAPIFCMMWAR